jgi:adenylate cyclase
MNQRKAATILVVDDDPDVRQYLADHLTHFGYQILAAESGEDALRVLTTTPVDLIVSDVNMPGMSGIEFCAAVKANPSFQTTPVILLTGASDYETRLAGLEAGADDFFTKPVDRLEIRTRVGVLLRVKALLDTTQRLYETVSAQAAELAHGKEMLEERVRQQVVELDRLAALKRFMSPQLAELVIASGEDPLRPHRQEVTVVFVDLRGFTAFAETSEPEEVMSILQEFHQAMGEIIMAHNGTLERYMGDGMMIVFNDPLPVPDPVAQAIRMSLAMRAREQELAEKWDRYGYDLRFGIGIAHGYATIGRIGFEGRWDYTAIGSVVNLAARLCGMAKASQILVPRRLLAVVDTLVDAETVGEFKLKGFHRPLPAYNVLRLKDEQS